MRMRFCWTKYLVNFENLNGTQVQKDRSEYRSQVVEFNIIIYESKYLLFIN